LGEAKEIQIKDLASEGFLGYNVSAAILRNFGESFSSIGVVTTERGYLSLESQGDSTAWSLFAGVAQWLEHQPSKLRVASSSLVSRSIWQYVFNSVYFTRVFFFR
jgi:hypothetical protein